MKHVVVILLLTLTKAVVAYAADPGPSFRPNLLVVVADDWSYPHAGAYGTAWVRTPAFDRIAREGVLFTRTYTPVAKCAASRASLLTGRNPWQLESGFVHNSFFPSHYQTYAEALDAAGYTTGVAGKGWAPGVALKADGTKRGLLGRVFNEHTAPRPTQGISANDYAANFAAFLAAAPADRPWSFWFGAHEPHRVYEYGTGAGLGGKKTSDIDRVPGYWPDDETIRNDMLDYAFEVEHFDRHLARMLALLEQRGELDRTLILVTGDNGMPFPRSKGQNYEIACHLPLAIRFPAVVKTPGRVVDDYVSFIDLAPTLLEAAGVDWAGSGMAPTPGRSLIPLMASPASGRIDPARDHVLLGRERHDPGRPHNQGYPTRGIVRDGWLYLRNLAPDRWPAGNPETGYRDVDSSPTKSAVLDRRRAAGTDPFWDACFGRRGEEELYDLSRDPDCLRNLAATREQAGRVAGMREVLNRELNAQADPRLLGRVNFFDEFRFHQEQSNDFYERWQRGEKLPIPAEDADAGIP